MSVPDITFKGDETMIEAILSNNDMIGGILQWSVTIIVAFFAGKLLINIAIGAASRTLNDEVERLAKARASHATTISQYELLINERTKDLEQLELQHANS